MKGKSYLQESTQERGSNGSDICEREFHRMRETVHFCICASLDAQMKMYTTISVPSKKCAFVHLCMFDMSQWQRHLSASKNRLLKFRPCADH